MNTIRPTDVGKRVSIQFFSDDGSRAEAVGTFERAEMEGGDVTMYVRKRDDTLVAVPVRRIRFGKVVGPPR
ncbi:MAG TPA: hypothetical protein VM840_00200 [Actinomycetota bacterium]|nr:hypothetical protein [Actinomycetota bacterium]